MNKSEGTAVTTKTQNVWAKATSIVQQKRTILLAASLAFFAPSVAAAAWYAGSVNVGNVTDSTDSDSSSYSHTSATSSADPKPKSNDGGSADTSASASVSAGEDGKIETKIVINGEKIEVPPNGSVQSTTYGSDGSTSNVSVSVNSSQNNNSSSGFSSTHLNTSTNSNSQNSNSTTSFNSNFHSSP